MTIEQPVRPSPEGPVVDNRTFEEVMKDLLPPWADSFMMQIQSKTVKQAVFWPVNLYGGSQHEREVSPS
jgi:hypothetical protein